MKLRLFAGIAAAMLGLSAPALAQEHEIKAAADPWVHAPTGTPFPAKVGAYERMGLTGFDGGETDVGVTYTIPGGAKQVIVGIYVYPTKGKSCDQGWADSKNELPENGAKLLSEDRGPSLSGRTAGASRHAMIDLPLPGVDVKLANSMTLYCVPGGQWFVKYIASWRIGGDSSEKDVTDLIRAIRWPAALGQ